MVLPLLALVPQQGIPLDFKSRQPLTRSFFIFVFIVPRSVELFDMVVEVGVTQCDIARRPAIVVYHLVWDRYQSVQATITDERGSTLLFVLIFDKRTIHVARLAAKERLTYYASGVGQIFRFFISLILRLLVNGDIIIINLIVILYSIVIIRV